MSLNTRWSGIVTFCLIPERRHTSLMQSDKNCVSWSLNTYSRTPNRRWSPAPQPSSRHQSSLGELPLTGSLLSHRHPPLASKNCSGLCPLIPGCAPVIESWATHITYPRNDLGRTTCFKLIFLPGSSNLRHTIPLILSKKTVLFPLRADFLARTTSF
ncbi:hypothetical protein PoB_006740300 [Plakobranchus ocellatus]|uniref:Uncharacterized protein n=1 Tax=Plakobranchus ocellatus TaxID=259542 RepID=A0AAV4DA12_9GAST|nr:hypothetical protein PoB_006740300 [Plakobranchus ocellatus]